MIMGSGLSAAATILENPVRIPYASIPHFPVPTVAGHPGNVVLGTIGARTAAIFEGRIHHYEGKTMEQVTFGARVIGRMGVRALIATNAAGAINPGFRSGQLMLITDHINLLGINPLVGPNDDRWGPRFVDQSEVYDGRLRVQIKAAAAHCGVALAEGVYASVTGPTYETPAEVRFLRAAGADAVGMSTVPEILVARHMGVRVAAVSMLSNVAAGLPGRPIAHEEVLKTAARMNDDLCAILRRLVETYAE